MTALCPFLSKYEKIIQQNNPDLKIVRGTHIPRDTAAFQKEIKEILCPKISVPQDMNDTIKGTLKTED